MADEATGATDTGEAEITTGTLVTDGPERKPDQGEGERKPDQGEGDQKPDGADAAEEARRAALTDEERAAEDTAAEAEAAAAEEARRAALTDEERAAEDAAKEREAGAPEEYADFTAPEGVELDSETLDQFKAIAKEDNLSQGAAQRYVDAAAQLMQNASNQLADSILETRQNWLDASKADKDFGGDKLDASLATAKRSLETYGTPALKELLDTTGLGNHPEIVRLLVKTGATVTEDKIVTGDIAGGEPRSLAERIYPEQGKK